MTSTIDIANALLTVVDLDDETDRLVLSDALTDAGRDGDAALCRKGEVRLLTIAGRESRIVEKDHVEFVSYAADPTMFYAYGPWSEYEAEMSQYEYFEVFERPAIEVFASEELDDPIASYPCWAELENYNPHAELLLRAIWRHIDEHFTGRGRIVIAYPDAKTADEVVDGPGQLAFDRPDRPSVRCISGEHSVEEDWASDWIPPDLAARGWVPRWPRADTPPLSGDE